MTFGCLARALVAGSWRPAKVLRWELAVMRLLFAWLLIDWLPAAMQFPTQPHPVGIAHWIDLGWVSVHYRLIRTAFRLLLVPYVLGLGLPGVLPLMAFLHLAIYTLYNSQGYVSHSVQVVSQVLVAQALVAGFFPGFRLLARRPFAFGEGLSRESYTLFFSQGVIVFSYVTSAVTKLLRSDGRWLHDLPNMPLGLLRTRLAIHYSDPDGAPPDAPALSPWLTNHPTAAIWIFGPGLFIELFAFVALRNRWLALLVGLSLVALHESIALVMKLDFAQNEWCAAIFLVNAPWWLWWIVRGRHASPAPVGLP